MITQVRREHAVAAFGERHAGGLPVTRRTEQAVQHHEGRTGAAEFADDQWERDRHGKKATVEALRPRSNHFPAEA
jgi:hypothetical protein